MNARQNLTTMLALVLFIMWANGACGVSPNIPSPTHAPTVTVTGQPETRTYTVTPQPDVVTRTVPITVTVTVSPSVTSSPIEALYTSPEEMRDVLVPAMNLDHCTEPARDMLGTMYVECLRPDGEIVRMSAWSEPALDNVSELKGLGWQVYGEPGWSVATNLRASTLEEAVTLLHQARGDH